MRHVDYPEVQSLDKYYTDWDRGLGILAVGVIMLLILALSAWSERSRNRKKRKKY